MLYESHASVIAVRSASHSDTASEWAASAVHKALACASLSSSWHCMLPAHGQAVLVPELETVDVR